MDKVIENICKEIPVATKQFSKKLNTILLILVNFAIKSLAITGELQPS